MGWHKNAVEPWQPRVWREREMDCKGVRVLKGKVRADESEM